MIFAFDVPARQAFVTEVVPEGRLRAAISLNAAVFQATRLIGPAIASLLIATAGTGWVFAVNAACYLGPTIGLLLLRPSDLQPAPAVAKAHGTMAADRPVPAAAPGRAVDDLPRRDARHVRPQLPDRADRDGQVGVRRQREHLRPVQHRARARVGGRRGARRGGHPAEDCRDRRVPRPLFGILEATAALAPDLAVFLALLVAMGFVNLVCQAMANASVQLAVDPELRGRVMGLYMLVFIGGTPFGAPVIGAITSHFGARAGMLVCGVIPAVAAVIMAAAVARRTRKEQQARPVPSDWEGLEILLGETALKEHA